MSWAIGYVERPNAEYQIIRYNSLKNAGMSLAELMAMKRPKDIGDLVLITQFLMWLEDQDESSFDEHATQLAFCELRDIMFVIGKYDAITSDPEKAAPYRVVQDHRDCKPGFCVGDIAKRN